MWYLKPIESDGWLFWLNQRLYSVDTASCWPEFALLASVTQLGVFLGTAALPPRPLFQTHSHNLSSKHTVSTHPHTLPDSDSCSYSHVRLWASLCLTHTHTHTHTILCTVKSKSLCHLHFAPLQLQFKLQFPWASLAWQQIYIFIQQHELL